MNETLSCDHCSEQVEMALARTVRLTVDRSEVDAQRLCPECFADWIDRYNTDMRPDRATTDDGETEIIVD